MASPKSYAFVSVVESSEVQVLDSIEPLVTASSDPLVMASCSTPSASSARVMDSIEPLVPTVQGILDEPVAGPSGIASGSGGSQPVIASSSVEDETTVYRPTGSSDSKMERYLADELRLLWNWRKIFSKLGTHDQCVQFAEERGLIPTEKICSYHHRPMSFTRESGQLGKFRCRKNKCRTKAVSRASGTVFEEAKLPLTVIFQVIYAFGEGLSYHQTRKELAYEDCPVVSHRTISEWYNRCRKVIEEYDIQNQREWPGEYLWRQRIYKNHLDAFEELIKAIKYKYSK